ncbi:MAG: CHAT domain-containing protein [Anaerolineales bacterium]
MRYLSFDLRLGEWDPDSRSGVAEVLDSPAGQGERYTFFLPRELISYDGTTYCTLPHARDLGRKLLEGAFSQDSLTLWYESYQLARERRRGLRLRLHINSWELSRLPWELMYDPRRGEFLVFDQRVSLVRYLRLLATSSALPYSSSLKILAVVASPHDQLQLDWRSELGVLQEAVGELVDLGFVDFSVCEHATYDRMHSALLTERPDVIHFIGHGEFDPQEERGYIILEDGERRVDPLDATGAARTFRRYGTRLVVLNACYTATGGWAGLAPALVRAEIPAVVAMQWPVEDEAAVRFSRAFYRSLALERPIDECVAEGRLGASATTSDPGHWGSPVLFLRSVSGQLWRTRTMSDDEQKPQDSRTPPQPAPAGPDADVGEEHAASLFKTRGPLVASMDGDLVVERPELKRALRIARQPSVTQYVAFLGPRQIGKTTLLFHLMERLRDTHACIFIDLSVLRAQDTRACFRFIAFRLLSELCHLLEDDRSLPETAHIEGSVDFLAFLYDLADAVPVSRIVLLVDEVGALTPEVSDSFFNTLRTVFTQGRGAGEELSKYLFIFSGAIDLYALTFGSNSPLNICEKVYLSDFSLRQVREIVRHFDRMGVSVEERVPELLYDLAGGHPYLTMRACALMEQDAPDRVTPDLVQRAADRLLLEDDNIRHVIRELENHPLERERLREILIEGRELAFSRNDLVLASLEMIGAVRPGQPCRVRNRLYGRALREYYQGRDEGMELADLFAEQQTRDDLELTYTHLQALHAKALGTEGTLAPNREWEAFAGALFSLVPAFSVYPHVQGQGGEILLTVGGEGTHWGSPAAPILVTCREGQGMDQDALLERAAHHGAELVFVMGGGASEGNDPSGTRGDATVVFLDDAEVTALLEERGDVEAFLRHRVRAARSRQT